MSLRTLSNLAVQDIADESAEIHSGGANAFFQGFDFANGTGAGPAQAIDNNEPLGLRRSYRFTPGTMLGILNNTVEGFKANNIASGREFKVEFYDNNTFGGLLDTLVFTNGTNGNFVSLIPNALNKTGSVRIFRTK